MDRRSVGSLFRHILSFLVIAGTATYLTLKFLQWNLEDGYIVYRLVTNLLGGHGWAYNPGQIYNPSTSVLNPALLAIFTPLLKDIPLTAHIVGGLSLFVVGISIAGLLVPLIGLVMGTAVAAVSMYSLAWAGTWGLETMLLAAIVLYAAVREQSGKVPWILYGFAVLARPDALLLVALRAGVYTLRKRALPIRELCFVLLPLLPWMIFSLLKFGEIFPATLPNKVWQGQSGFWGGGFVYLRGLKDHLLANPYYLREGLWFIPQINLVPRWTIVVLGIPGAIRLLRDGHVLVWSLVFAVLHQAVYAGFNVPAYHWYFALIDLFSVLCSGITIASVLQMIRDRFVPMGAGVGTGFGAARLQHAQVSNTVPTLALLSMLAIVGLFLRDWKMHVSWSSGNEHYLAAAQTILERTDAPPGSLAAVEVGTLGYYVNREIFDFIGLTSPNSQVLSGEHVDEFFTNNPAVVVLHEPVWDMERAVVSDPRFVQTYDSGIVVSQGTTPLRIRFRKRDHAPPLEEALAMEARRLAPLVLRATDTHEAVKLEEGRCQLKAVNGRAAVQDFNRSNRVVGSERVVSLEFSVERELSQATVWLKDRERTFTVAAYRDASAGLPRWRAEFGVSSLPRGRFELELRGVLKGSDAQESIVCKLKDSIRNLG